MGIENLKQRVAELEEAEHEAIFALGRTVGAKEAVRQILEEQLLADEDDEDITA
jgi:hypothetical protein